MGFWYFDASPGVSCFEHSFTILFGMPSGPDALGGFNCLSNFSTPFYLIFRNGIHFTMCFFVLCNVLLLSLVNTDLNCCISNSTASLLSFTILVVALQRRHSYDVLYISRMALCCCFLFLPL